MSKPRHASQPSRKRSALVAVILLVILGLVSAGFWFASSQNNPQPAPTPTVTATPTPTVSPTPEPTPTPTPTPTINENELSVRVWAKGTDNQNNYLWVAGWVNGSDETTRFKVEASLFDSIASSQTYIFTVSDEPDGVPLIIAVR